MGTRHGGLARRGRSFGWPALALTVAALIVAAAAVAAGAAVVANGYGGDRGDRSAPRIADLGGVLTQPDATDGGDRLVVLFGDSFSESALPGTRRRFLDDPRLRLSPNVYGGTTLDTQTWMDGYPGVGDGSIVLLFLGTNDISTDTIAEVEDDAREAIDTASSAGAERVVVTTINTTGRPPDQDASWTDRARAFNDWLRQADTDPVRYPTLQVVDWDDASRGRTDWLAFDGIHLNPAGQAAYTEMTYAAARAAAGLPAAG